MGMVRDEIERLQGLDPDLEIYMKVVTVDDILGYEADTGIKLSREEAQKIVNSIESGDVPYFEVIQTLIWCLDNEREGEKKDA